MCVITGDFCPNNIDVSNWTDAPHGKDSRNENTHAKAHKEYNSFGQKENVYTVQKSDL